MYIFIIIYLYDFQSVTTTLGEYVEMIRLKLVLLVCAIKIGAILLMLLKEDQEKLL